MCFDVLYVKSCQHSDIMAYLLLIFSLHMASNSGRTTILGSLILFSTNVAPIYNTWMAANRRPILTVSNPTPNGNHAAGLLTAAKSNAAVVLPKIPFQYNDVTKGRVQITLLQRISQSGIVLVNAYFYHSEGMSEAQQICECNQAPNLALINICLLYL